MSGFASADDALAFVREHGVVLLAAKGPAPRLTEAIIGEPIKGSWWAHPRSHFIFRMLNGVTTSADVLACRIIDGKVTLVHRRLWPALVRIAGRLPSDHLAQVHEEHTASGRHIRRDVPFPQWVPDDVTKAARAMGEQEAIAALGAWLSNPVPVPEKARGTKRKPHVANNTK
jgi:hypothetical protein